MLNNFPIKIQGNLFRTAFMSHRARTDAYISVFILFDLLTAMNYWKIPPLWNTVFCFFSFHNGYTLPSSLESHLNSLASIFSGFYDLSRSLKFGVLQHHFFAITLISIHSPWVTWVNDFISSHSFTLISAIICQKFISRLSLNSRLDYTSYILKFYMNAWKPSQTFPNQNRKKTTYKFSWKNSCPNQSFPYLQIKQKNKQ